MSGVWDSMLAHDERLTDSTIARDDWVHAHIAGAGKTQKLAWDACHTWVLDLIEKHPWEDLPEKVAIGELRKGTRSLYYQRFQDDPTVKCDCPKCGWVVVGAEGYCDQCTWEFDR